MKKLFVLNILALLLLMFSCSEQIPKHLILGKWESSNSPKLTLNFDEEKYLKGEISSSNGYVYKYNRQYFVIDDNNVFIIDKSVGQEVTIEAKIDKDKMSFNCVYKSTPNQPTIVDLPELCNYREFTRVE